MKVLLLQPKMNWNHPYCETPSVALLTLGAIARQYGHEVTVRHMDIDPLPDEIPDLVGITCNTFQVRNARELVKHYQGKCRIVVGGPHAVAWSEKDGRAEVVIGEGENQWLGILGFDKGYGSIDDIPLPDYSLVDMTRFSGVAPMGAVPSMVLFGSRGCPGKCIFCNTPAFWGSKVRYRNPVKIVDQVQYLHDEFGVQEVFFQDDTFNANHKWAFAIFHEIIRRGLNKQMIFRIDCRANASMLTEEFVAQAKQAGVWNIFLGIESGSQKILDNIRKHVTVEECKRAIKLVNSYGIYTQCSFIIGLPGETWQTLKETQELINETKPAMIGSGYATPFPGTELDRIVTERGHKRDVDYADYVYGQILTRTEELDYEALATFRGFTNER
jgi:radical SAM superfamily enzyme YgiQ (UPF0313 family)